MAARPPRGSWAGIQGPRDERGRRLAVDAMLRFREKCRFEPETGCVVWIGGTTMGRGHHVPYPSFWYEGKRWFGHRWAARFIHGLDIDSFHVDHCCPHIMKPNTLCVEHLQAITPRLNRQLQETRKTMIHLQVGLLQYEEVYGPQPDEHECNDIPFHSPPAWLGLKPETSDECPF